MTAVLAARHRLRRSSDFSRVMREGRRAGSSTLVVHRLGTNADAAEPPRVGFVVSRRVGPSVVRHRVARRLRHLVRDRVDALPPGDLVVVRAMPAAATASGDDVARDLDRCLKRSSRQRAS